MIVIATLSSERALALLRNRYEIIFHDCFTTVIANSLIYIGSAVGHSAIFRFFLSTYRLVHLSNTKDSRISVLCSLLNWLVLPVKLFTLFLGLFTFNIFDNQENSASCMSEIHPLHDKPTADL